MIQIFDKYGKLKSSGIPGFGTVTSVSATSLSPLFTTTVNNPTTTPSLSFNKINQGEKLFYASPNVGSGAPSFRNIQISDLPSLSGIYVPTSRTITINGVTQNLLADRTWTIPTLSVWGSISGTLSDQTDLQNALDLKQNTIGFTPENVANKATDLTSPDNTKYPTTLAVVNENKKATITVELIDLLTTNFYAPNALRINSTALISGSGTITLKVNDVAYTLGNLIAQGAKITVETTTASVYNLISVYE